MSEQELRLGRTIRGTIRRRLLVNAFVDPDEAARHLPGGVRPHVTGGDTVVGCCLLDIRHIRPALLPRIAGMSLRAAAHRISAEWDDDSGVTTVGVYVPVRHTDSCAAVMLGGRWFPGVHLGAAVEVVETADTLCWTVVPTDRTAGFGFRVAASVLAAAASAACEPVGATCLGAAVGVSPDHHGLLEAARMVPAHRRAQQVRIDAVESEFLASFDTARPTTSYLMRDVDVTWTPGTARRLALAKALP